MRSKINYYILIPKGEWERVSESLNKAVVTMSISVKEFGNAFGGLAKILRDDKFYEAICEANRCIEGHKKLKEGNNAKSN